MDVCVRRVTAESTLAMSVVEAEAFLAQQGVIVRDRAWSGDAYVVAYTQRRGERVELGEMVFPVAAKLSVDRLY